MRPALEVLGTQSRNKGGLAGPPALGTAVTLLGEEGLGEADQQVPRDPSDMASS